MSLTKTSVQFPHIQKRFINRISQITCSCPYVSSLGTSYRQQNPTGMNINRQGNNSGLSSSRTIRPSFFHTMTPLSQVDNSSSTTITNNNNSALHAATANNDGEVLTITPFEEENLNVLAEDIKNLTKSRNGGYEAARKAEQLLHQMEHVAKARGSNPPSVFLYNQVVSMYGQENRPREAEQLLRKMQQLASNHQNPRAQPDRVTYNACIAAWANSATSNAAPRAESLLREMVAMYRKGPKHRPKQQQRPQGQQQTHQEQQQQQQQQDQFLSNDTDNDAEEMDNNNNDTDDDDDIEYRIRPDVWSFNTTIAAWARDERNPHHAYDILNEMIRFSELVPEVKPDTVTLSSVIRALCKSKRRGALQEAEAILNRMELLADAGDDTVRPDAISYTTLMIGLANQKPKHRKQNTQGSGSGSVDANGTSTATPEQKEEEEEPSITDKVIRLLKRMEERYQEKGDVGVKPDTVAFNAVLLAIANSGEQDCGVNAERLLDKMHSLYVKGNHDVCPTAISYSTTMLAWKNSGLLDAGDHAEALLRRMQKYYYDDADYAGLEPNTVCFSTVISTFANSGTRHGAERAESLLEEMHQLYCSGGHDKVEPNTVTYTSVIEAWVATGSGGAIDRAEKIVEQMEEMSASGNKNSAPSTITYNLLIKGVEKCQVDHKAEKALGILQRMQERYDSGECAAKPNIRTYNAVFQACAATPSQSEQDKKHHAIMVVLDLLRDMKERNMDVDKYTYPAAMKACANLYNHNKKNNSKNQFYVDAIDEIFQRCCNDGMLDPMVLSHVRRVAPEYLEKVTGIVPATLVKLDKVPKRWSARIRRRRNKLKR